MNVDSWMFHYAQIDVIKWHSVLSFVVLLTPSSAVISIRAHLQYITLQMTSKGVK